MNELSENEINLALYFIYLKGNLILEWLKYDKYNKEVKLYELINEEVMKIHVKEIKFSMNMIM